MRKTARWTSFLYTVIWLFILLLGFYILLQGYHVIIAGKEGENVGQIKTEMIMEISNRAISFCIPSFEYITMEESKKEEDGIEKKLFDLAFSDFLISDFVAELENFDTVTEVYPTYDVLMPEDMEVAENESDQIIEENEQSLEEAAENENAAANASAQASASSIEYSLEKLADFDYLRNTFYTIDKTTTITSSELNAADMLARDMKISTDNSKPQILIYHTHSQEDFVDTVEGDPETTIIGVGNYLTKLLTEQYGFQVIHDTTVYDVIDGELDRSKAYSMALPSITQILNTYPSIEVVIDLHRDGVDENTKLVTEVNGKPTAKIMFFNGLSRTTKNGDISYLPNPNIKDNLAFSFQLQLKLASQYPDMTRHIYLKGYRYNLHLRPKSLLIEAGAQTNTSQEVKNAMEPLAKALAEVLKGE